MRIVKFIFTLLFFFSFLSVSYAQEPVRGGTLVMGLGQAPRHLNPAVQSGVSTGAPGTQLFATLLRYDHDWTPQPYLAKSWDVSPDGLTITLDLVEDAVFHDGVPITSSDVEYSLDVIRENHPFKTMLQPLESVETPTPHRVILRLSEPHPVLLLSMSGSLMPIIPRHIYDDGQDIRTHPRNSVDVIGSGPFKLVEFKPGEHIILERHDDFFIPGRPYLDRIIMRIMTDSAARTIAMENGELSLIAFEDQVRNINRMKEVSHLTATSDGYGAIGAINWVAFNTVDGPTSDVNVRRAIAYAIDRNFILDSIMFGTAMEAKTGIHPSSPFYDSSFNGYDLDISKANSLLDSAGYERDSDGIRFPLTIDFGWPNVKAEAEYIRTALKKIGIAVRVRSSADMPTWMNRVSNYDFQMTMDTLFNWGDPVLGVHRNYLSSNIKKGVIWTNTQQYKNPEVDKILDQAGKELDTAKRKELYSRFQQIVTDDLPVYWLTTLPFHTIYNNKVGNPPLGIWSTLAPMDRVYLNP